MSKETMHETMQKTMQRILEKCKTGNYIFRGEQKKYEEVSSGLRRYYFQHGETKIDIENFSIISVEKSIIERARSHFSINALNIEILTELQHYGGTTGLIDFTRDINIALFFACNGKVNEDGRVILLNTAEHIPMTDIDYHLRKTCVVPPASKNSRVVFQSSMFVHTPKGCLGDGEYKCIRISKEDKENILIYLRKYFNINESTIYNDLQGFISSEKNYLNAHIEFYLGLTQYDNGQLEKALVHYNNAIRLDPLSEALYNNRGVVKFQLHKLEDALDDYDKALELNPSFMEAYGNRGNVKRALENYEEAIKDYDIALGFNPEFSDPYFGRAVAKSMLRKFEESIKDYDSVIKLEPQFAMAYFNRAGVKATINRVKEAIEDAEIAKDLFRKEGDEKHFHDACEAIKGLKGR